MTDNGRLNFGRFVDKAFWGLIVGSLSVAGFLAVRYLDKVEKMERKIATHENRLFNINSNLEEYRFDVEVTSDVSEICKEYQEQIFYLKSAIKNLRFRLKILEKKMGVTKS